MTYVYHAPPLHPHGSQFIKLNDGSILRGGCTLISLAAGDILSKGNGAWVLGGTAGDPASVPNVQAVMRRAYYDALARKNCQSNGAMRQVDVLNEAKAIGLPVLATLPLLNGVAPYDAGTVTRFIRRWNTGDAAYGGNGKQYPILWQVAKGRNFSDALGGGSDEAGLDVHAVLSYGTYTDDEHPGSGGYVFVDGDNGVANQRPSIYSLATLLAALPITATVFGYVHDPFTTQPTPKPVPVPKPNPVPAPKPDPSASYRAALQSIATTANAALKG